MKTYDEHVSFCHRCGLFNNEVKNVKRNNVMDATISTSGLSTCTCFGMFLHACSGDCCNSQPMGRRSRCGNTLFSDKFESPSYGIQNEVRNQ